MTAPLHFKRLDLSGAELKLDDGEAMNFSGYASIFNGIDAVGDSVVPGAFTETLKNRDRPVGMYFNHASPTIGRWTKMVEDEKGLYVEGSLTPGHSVASDVYASLKHGSVGWLSIGFRIRDGGAELRQGIRYLKAVELIEVSVVEQPADLGAQVEDVKASRKDLERALRNHLGLSKNEAVGLVAKGWKGMQSEPEDEGLARALAQFNEVLRG